MALKVLAAVRGLRLASLKVPSSRSSKKPGAAARMKLALAILFTLLVVPHVVVAIGYAANGFDHWSRASWDSTGLAPDPATTQEAVVQVYAARAWGWRGVFGAHTWIAMKPEGARGYDRFDVVGWGVHSGAPAVRRNIRPVDGHWAGNPPQVLLERRGPEAQALIGRLQEAIAAYPYPDLYRTWPGPNSNTFIAHLAREVPELRLAMPPLAVGKDYLGPRLVARTPSGTGFQVSLLGVLGVSLGLAEGLELNLLGLTLGVDPLGLAVKLPGFGRLGLA
jgi:hypothetical protein